MDELGVDAVLPGDLLDDGVVELAEVGRGGRDEAGREGQEEQAAKVRLTYFIARPPYLDKTRLRLAIPAGGESGGQAARRSTRAGTRPRALSSSPVPGRRTGRNRGAPLPRRR